MSPWKKPVAWFKGEGMNMTSPCVRPSSLVKTRSENRMLLWVRLLWVSIDCFGLPVVPEVGRMQATESADTATGSSTGSKRR